MFFLPDCSNISPHPPARPFLTAYLTFIFPTTFYTGYVCMAIYAFRVPRLFRRPHWQTLTSLFPLTVCSRKLRLFFSDASKTQKPLSTPNSEWPPHFRRFYASLTPRHHTFYQAKSHLSRKCQIYEELMYVSVGTCQSLGKPGWDPQTQASVLKATSASSGKPQTHSDCTFTI